MYFLSIRLLFTNFSLYFYYLHNKLNYFCTSLYCVRHRLTLLLFPSSGWLDKQAHMHANAMAVYTFLRVVADHMEPSLTNLRTKEVNFCVSILLHKVSLLVLISCQPDNSCIYIL